MFYPAFELWIFTKAATKAISKDTHLLYKHRNYTEANTHLVFQATQIPAAIITLCK